MNSVRHSIAAALSLLAFAAAPAALAQPVTDAYAVGGASGVIARNPYGLCWRTYSWTEAKAVAECDPSLVAKPAPKAPVAAASAPAPAPAPAPVVVAPAAAPVVAAAPRDSDGDGVPDDADRCPGTRAGAKVDPSGCEVAEVLVLKGVNFATNSARLTPDSLKTLDTVAATLTKRGNPKTEVAGHTDNRGSAVRNKALSQQRAEAVMKYLVAKGVAAASLSAHGYGQDAPLASNASESGRAENRRVELRAQ